MRAVVATNNKHKLEEIKSIFGDKDIELLSLSDINIDIDVDETGSTFKENALLKAREVGKITGELVIADDSGLEVEALNGRPGINSARYSGYTGKEKDSMNRKKLLEELVNVPLEKRNARFCCSIAAVFPDGREIVEEGFVYGKIGYEEKGNFGFGYDSLFIVDDFNLTMAELSPEIKNKISHRANALKNFHKKFLENLSSK